MQAEAYSNSLPLLFSLLLIVLVYTYIHTSTPSLFNDPFLSNEKTTTTDQTMRAARRAGAAALLQFLPASLLSRARNLEYIRAATTTSLYVLVEGKLVAREV